MANVEMVISLAVVRTLLKLPSAFISSHEPSIAMPDNNVMRRMPIYTFQQNQIPIHNIFLLFEAVP